MTNSSPRQVSLAESAKYHYENGTTIPLAAIGAIADLEAENKRLRKRVVEVEAEKAHWNGDVAAAKASVAKIQAWVDQVAVILREHGIVAPALEAAKSDE